MIIVSVMMIAEAEMCLECSSAATSGRRATHVLVRDFSCDRGAIKMLISSLLYSSWPLNAGPFTTEGKPGN